MDPHPDESPYGDLIQPAPGEQEPGPDPLRAIVARAGRVRRQALAGVAAAALLAGGAAGYAIAGTGGGSNRPGAAAISPSTGQSGSPSAASGTGGGSASGGGVADVAPAINVTLTHLFTRTVGSVTVRGFESASAAGVPGPSCQSTSSFRAELSTPAMVGIAESFSYANKTSPISSVAPSVVGVAEGDPVLVVISSTSSNVTSVTANFADGSSDTMTPVKGWAALVTPLSAAMSNIFKATPQKSLGTLTASDSSGKSLGTKAIEQTPLSPLFACAEVCPPTPVMTPATGAAGAATNMLPACKVGPPIQRTVVPPMTTPGCKPPATIPNGVAWGCIQSGTASSGTGSSGSASSGSASTTG